MHRTIRTTALALAALVLGGCASEADIKRAAAGKAQGRQLLGDFAAAIRQDAAQDIRPLLVPGLSSAAADNLELRAARASWLRFYGGYTIDLDAAVDDPRVRDWRRGEFWLKAPCSNALGRRFTDRFELAQVGGQWRLRNFELHTPQFGAPLDPPPEVRAAIAARVKRIVDGLKEGKTGAILYDELPEEGRDRPARPGVFARLFRRPTPPVPLVHDLNIVCELTVLRWPKVDQSLDLRYFGGVNIGATLEVPYYYAPGGVGQEDILEIVMFFAHQQGQWRLKQLRFYGRAIP
jgi:hypothetical protein